MAARGYDIANEEEAESILREQQGRIAKGRCPLCGWKMKSVMFTVKYGSAAAKACTNPKCSYEERV